MLPLEFDDSAKEVSDRICKAWCAETSCCRQEFDKNHRGKGQSAATALLVQDYFNGRIMCTVADGGRHYWNRINGIDIDLTRCDIIKAARIFEESRNGLLKVPTVKERYELLKKRVEG